MYEIHVSTTIAAPAEQVFDALTNYEHFFRGPGSTCRLIQEGREQRNGLGAVREIVSAGLVFTEEITKFDPPREFEYVIRKLVNGRGKPIRLRHERGWIEVVPTGTATRVDWYSRFAVPIPVLGWFLERFLGARGMAGFQRLLERAKAELEGELSTKVR